MRPKSKACAELKGALGQAEAFGGSACGRFGPKVERSALGSEPGPGYDEPMAGQFLLTIGDKSQISGVLDGRNLQGRAEPRFAMVGRSNVGKSTLINSLLGGTYARVSQEPGKTRAIHLYLWKEAGKIVADLPGYGFAKVAKAERDRWAKFINAYLRADEALERAVVLLDGRHGPTDSDIEAIRFLSGESVPMTLVFTKIDAIRTQSERAKRKKEASQALLEIGFDPTLAHWVSAKEGTGLNRLVNELKGIAPPTRTETVGGK